MRQLKKINRVTGLVQVPMHANQHDNNIWNKAKKRRPFLYFGDPNNKTQNTHMRQKKKKKRLL